jgi:signal transduction histidine kinase
VATRPRDRETLPLEVGSRLSQPNAHPQGQESRRSVKLAIGFILSALFITAVGLLFDRLMLHEGISRISVMVVSNLLTGIVAAGLFLQIKRNAEEKQRLWEQRVQKLADMNHHVRNALQVLAYYASQTDDSRAAKLIKESIQRIEWTLIEVLPRGWELDRLRKVSPIVDPAQASSVFPPEPPDSPHSA